MNDDTTEKKLIKSFCKACIRPITKGDRWEHNEGDYRHIIQPYTSNDLFREMDELNKKIEQYEKELKQTVDMIEELKYEGD